MSIGAVGSNNPLQSALQAKGLSSKTIAVVQTDMKDVLQTTSEGGAKPSATDVRARIDARLAEDVASGKISAEDAGAVGQALDKVDPSAADEGASAPSGGTGSGGGGGGESSEKTELSRITLVAGRVKIIIITYTDKTTETKTSVATDNDAKTADKSSKTANGSTAQTVKDYLATIEPGSLFDAFA
ncbi:MAG TPA: hypothetical protein VF463_21610 [Sphingobium sp.]